MANVVINISRDHLPKGWYYSRNELGEFAKEMCPLCRFIQSDDADNFDIMGLDEDHRQCLNCGELVIPALVTRVPPLKTRDKPTPLFPEGMQWCSTS